MPKIDDLSQGFFWYPGNQHPPETSLGSIWWGNNRAIGEQKDSLTREAQGGHVVCLYTEGVPGGKTENDVDSDHETRALKRLEALSAQTEETERRPCL